MNKQALSLLLKKVFFKLGVYGFFRSLFPNRKISILRYHAVVPNKDNYYTSHAIALSPEEFERHVRYFAGKYTVLSLDEIIDLFKEKKPIPKNSVAFTFDDGYLDNLLAAKILNKYGAHGTFFIVTEAIGRESLLWLSEVTYMLLKTPNTSFSINAAESNETLPLGNTVERWKAIRHLVKLIKSNNRAVRKEVRKQLLEQVGTPELLQDVKDLMLTWDQVKEMVDLGMIIGSHTLSHLNLPNAEADDAVKEITQAKKVIEDRLGTQARHFSYPNSGPYAYFDERIRKYVVEAGYDSSCTSNNGFVDADSDAFALERVRTVPDLEEVVHDMEWSRVLGG